jgi:adenosine kinase
MKKTSAFFVIISIVLFIVYGFHSKSSKEYKTPLKMPFDKLTFIGFGSPIVDGILNYESNPKLAEELKSKMKYHLTKESSKELYYSAFDSEYTEILLGGSALNSVRIINYLLNIFKINKLQINGYDYDIHIPDNLSSDCMKKNQFGYIGAIGKDKYGDFVKNKLSEEDVVLMGPVVEDKITSTAIVLIESRERNIFAHISASRKIKAEDFQNYSDIISLSKIFYADSYLIKLSFSSYEYVFKIFANTEVLLALSLSNDSLIEDNFEKFISLFPHCDIIIGNSEEYEIIKKLMGMAALETFEFFEKFSEKFEKTNKHKKRIIINTRGKNSTLIYVKDYVINSKELIEVPLIEVDENEIIDLNGAGDGFAGGFFTGILLNLDLYQSGLLGNKIASEIIKLKGFQLPYQLSENNPKNTLKLEYTPTSKRTHKLDL